MTGISIGFDDRTLTDSEKLYFGSDEDFSLWYDDGESELVLTDEQNNTAFLYAENGGNFRLPTETKLAPLGRFARINANIGWEYDTLADVPNWVSTSGSESNWTFNVNSRPRRLHVDHDGTGGSTDFGGIAATSVVTHDSLGGFKVTFKDVSFTANDTSNHYIITGLTDINDMSATPINSGNGIVGVFGSLSRLRVVNSGSTSDSGISSLNWSNNHDITLSYDGSEAELFVDGSSVATVSTTLHADFSPFIQMQQDSGSSSSETLECEQITVEPL